MKSKCQDQLTMDIITIKDDDDSKLNNAKYTISMLALIIKG